MSILLFCAHPLLSCFFCFFFSTPFCHPLFCSSPNCSEFFCWLGHNFHELVLLYFIDDNHFISSVPTQWGISEQRWNLQVIIIDWSLQLIFKLPRIIWSGDHLVFNENKALIWSRRHYTSLSLNDCHIGIKWDTSVWTPIASKRKWYTSR